MEAASNDYSDCAADSCDQARLSAALDAMDALFEASEFVRALGQCLVPVNDCIKEETTEEGGSSAPPSSPQLATLASSGLESFNRWTVKAAESASASQVSQLRESVLVAAEVPEGSSTGLLATAAGVLASAAISTATGVLLSGAMGAAAAVAITAALKTEQPAVAAPAIPIGTLVAASVEGLLRVECDLLEIDIELLRETLELVLLRLLEPLAQLVQIRLPPVDAEGGAASPSGVAFAYRVNAADPHDVEPLRETLLLEAESGGARRLLPLLCEQLCDNGVPTPRHLKVRMEVRGETT